MEALLKDVRHAIRVLRRNPGYTTVAVLMLGLGIGAATALFSVVHAVLLRPLPYPESDRIVQLWQLNEEGVQTGVSDPNFADWQEQSRSFAALAQFQASIASVSGGTEPVRSMSAEVSRDFFDAIGVRPVLGREFLPEEQHEGANPVVIVSHEFWQSQLGGDPNLAELTLSFRDGTYTVLGVMPPGFDFPFGAALWTPRELRPVLPSRTALNWQVIGRLHDGVALAQAQQELSLISRRLKQEHGEDTWMVDAAVVPLHEQLVGRVRPILFVLLGAAGFLLLVAGANTANLMLARLASRQRELAVRVALGASRWRLAQQSLTESLLLSLTGAALGVLVASWGVRALLRAEPGNLPRAEEIGVNAPVLLFAFGLAVLTALVLSLVGALRASGADVRGGLGHGQRSETANASTRRVQGGLIAAQVALTLVLLVGAGLLGRTLLGLLAIDPGFRTSGVLTMNVSFSGIPDERLPQVHEQIITGLRALPGVADAGGISSFPLTGTGASGMFLIQAHPDEITGLEDFETVARNPERTGYAEFRVAGAGYFRAMGVSLVSGRLFDDRDAADAPHVAVISESLARTRWPGEDPRGKLIQFGNMDGDVRPLTIVGVVADVRDRSIEGEPRPTLYALHQQRPVTTSNFTYVLHGPGDVTAHAAAARHVLAQVAPDVPPRFRTVDELLTRPLAPRRFSLLLLGIFGATALLLAALGIYGVTAYAVSQRTREIGIRLALGARSGSVLRLVVRQSVILALVGVSLGVAAALALARVLAHMLYGVATSDPVTLATAVAFLLAMALLSSYLPARRAARVDPMIALRAE